MSGEGGSFGHVSVHVGADWRADCHSYGGGTPILSVDAGQCSVSFSIADRNASEAAVQFARALVREAQVFAAEVERLHSAQPAGNGEDGDSKAVDVDAA